MRPCWPQWLIFSRSPPLGKPFIGRAMSFILFTFFFRPFLLSALSTSWSWFLWLISSLKMYWTSSLSVSIFFNSSFIASVLMLFFNFSISIFSSCPFSMNTRFWSWCKYLHLRCLMVQFEYFNDPIFVALQENLRQTIQIRWKLQARECWSAWPKSPCLSSWSY